MKTKRVFLFGLPVALLTLGLVVAASLALAGCGGEEDGDGDGGTLVGTWAGSGAVEGSTLTFTDTTWTQKEAGGSTTSGTYTYNGTTLTFIVPLFGSFEGTAVISGSALTLSGFDEETGVNGTYTKVTAPDPGPGPGGSDLSNNGILTFTDRLPTVSDSHLTGLKLTSGHYSINVAPNDASWTRPNFTGAPPPSKPLWLVAPTVTLLEKQQQSGLTRLIGRATATASAL
jgi:hypothetical protein